MCLAVHQKTVHTLRLFDGHRFSNTWSSRTGIVDGNNPEVIVCPFSEACHGVR